MLSSQHNWCEIFHKKWVPRIYSLNATRASESILKGSGNRSGDVAHLIKSLFNIYKVPCLIPSPISKPGLVPYTCNPSSQEVAWSERRGCHCLDSNFKVRGSSLRCSEKAPKHWGKDRKEQVPRTRRGTYDLSPGLLHLPNATTL